MKINDLLANLTLEEKIDLLLGNNDYSNHKIDNFTINTFSIKSINKMVDRKVNKMTNCFDVELISNYISYNIKGLTTNNILDLDINFSNDKSIDDIFKRKIMNNLSQNFFVLYRTDVFVPTYEDIKKIIYFANDNIKQFKGLRVFSEATDALDAIRKINDGAIQVFVTDDIRKEVISKAQEYTRYFNDFNRKEITEEVYKNYLDSLGDALIVPSIIDEVLARYFDFLQDLECESFSFNYDFDDYNRLLQTIATNNHVLLKNLGVLPLKDKKVVTINCKNEIEGLNILKEINNLPFNNACEAVEQNIYGIIDLFDTVVIKLDASEGSITEDKIQIIDYLKSVNKKVLGIITADYLENVDVEKFDALIYRRYVNEYSDLALGLLLSNNRPFNGYLVDEMLGFGTGYGLTLGDIVIDSYKNDVLDHSVVVRNNSQFYGAKLMMLYINNILEDFKSCEVKPGNGEKVYLRATHKLSARKDNKVSLRCDRYNQLFDSVIKKAKGMKMEDNKVVSEFVGEVINDKPTKVNKFGRFKYLLFILIIIVAAIIGNTAIEILIIPEVAHYLILGVKGLALVLIIINIIKFIKTFIKKKSSVNKTFGTYADYSCDDVVTQVEPIYEEPVILEEEVETEVKTVVNYDYKEELNHEVKSIKFNDFYNGFTKYLEQHDLKIEHTQVIDLLSAMTMSRLIFVKGKSDVVKPVLTALFNYFDNTYNETNISFANNVVDLYESQGEMSSLLKVILAAKDNANKMYMTFITGLNKDNEQFFETNLLDLNSKHNEYKIEIGVNKVINLPKNLWYFVSSDDYNTISLTKSSVTVSLDNVYGDSSSFELSEKPIDVILYNREISSIKEQYYLDEEDYKKLDEFYLKLNELCDITISNKDLVGIENFIACYKMFNDNKDEVLDKLLLMRFVPLIKTICLEKDIKNTLISTINNLFGENILLRTIKALNE